MAEFRMPSLGADMDEGTLLEWRVKPGDRVERGQIVALVDTEKAEIEVECWQSGVVERLIAEVGQTLPVGAPLAVLRGDGADAVSAPAVPVAPAPVPAPVSLPLPAQPRPSAAVRVHASPLARRLAQERGIGIGSVHGSGPGGTIVADDVRRAGSAAAAPAPVPERAPRDRREGMRRAIAAAMAKSKREIPHYYLATPIDCTRALDWLRERNQRSSVNERVLPIALLIAATAKALRSAPDLCGHYVDGGFRSSAGIHVAVAVSLRGGGLVAPVVRDADALPLDTLMGRLRELTQRSREGRLRSSDVADAGITVTSLGDLGVETVFPVIHPPQVAILGFGRIAETPWAEHGMLAVRQVVRCTLAADHRVSDGMRGARLLAEIARLLAKPEEL